MVCLDANTQCKISHIEFRSRRLWTFMKQSSSGKYGNTAGKTWRNSSFVELKTQSANFTKMKGVFQEQSIPQSTCEQRILFNYCFALILPDLLPVMCIKKLNRTFKKLKNLSAVLRMKKFNCKINRHIICYEQ